MLVAKRVVGMSCVSDRYGDVCGVEVARNVSCVWCVGNVGEG